MSILATPWRRYGKDRTYLSQEDGTALGWVDNVTGAVHAESEEAALLITGWLGEAGGPGEGERSSPLADVTVAVEPEPAGLETSELSDPVGTVENASALPTDPVAEQELLPEWEDLALRRPGHAVREQARTELSANWEKSKLKTVLQIAFDTHTDERAWRLGASGEVAIGSRLEKLAEHGWRVLHSVPVGERGSDVDHIVIGPGGVWTINAKNHPGKKIWVSPRQIRVDGHTVPYLRNAEFEADRVRKILLAQLGWEPYVRPALVFMTGTLVPEVTIKGKPERVEILDRMDVTRRLKREPARMTAHQVDEVFEVARRSTTWVR